MKPLISIALPVFNGAATLGVAIQSILNQSYRDWELIILDDASSDDSREVMRSFDDPRIRLVEGEANIGLSARLNMAVELAKGEYFARMDQDDVSFPERFEKQLEYLQKHPDVDLLASSIIVFKGNGDILGKVEVKCKHRDICSTPWSGFYMPHPTWMGKTAWFRQHQYESHADGAEDQHLLLRTYRVSRFACMETPLLAYREGDRPLKKMLRARRIFVRIFVRHFIAEGRYVMAMGVVVLSAMKTIFDTLYSLTHARFMRNTLLPLSKSELTRMNMLWHELDRLNE